MQRWGVTGVQADYIHKFKAVLNTTGNILILLFQWIVLHERHVPTINLM